MSRHLFQMFRVVDTVFQNKNARFTNREVQKTKNRTKTFPGGVLRSTNKLEEYSWCDTVRNRDTDLHWLRQSSFVLRSDPGMFWIGGSLVVTGNVAVGVREHFTQRNKRSRKS